MKFLMHKIRYCLGVFFLISSHSLFSHECTHSAFECVIENLEGNLMIHDEKIFVEVENKMYEVQQLVKETAGWRATLNHASYCPSGHPVCKNCGLCHLKRCSYYVKPCNLWDTK